MMLMVPLPVNAMRRRAVSIRSSFGGLRLRRSWHLFELVRFGRLPQRQWAYPSAGLDE